VEHYFGLLNWQNENEDNDYEIQHYLVIYEGDFYVLPDHNKSLTGVIFEEASI